MLFAARCGSPKKRASDHQVIIERSLSVSSHCAVRPGSRRIGVGVNFEGIGSAEDTGGPNNFRAMSSSGFFGFNVGHWRQLES